MLFSLALALLGSPSVADLNALIGKKDINGLTQLLAPLPAGQRNPFKVIKTGGAYGVGRYPWKAAALQGLDGADRFVVISTLLTSEDVGDILLKRSGDKLEFIPESEDMGVRIKHHDLDVRFHIPTKSADLKDTIQIAVAKPSSEFVFRLSSQYIVSAIKDSTGTPVQFKQVGGIVLCKTPAGTSGEYTLTYKAVVNLPQYAGSIEKDEATLVNDYWMPLIARKPATFSITVHGPKDWLNVSQGEKQSDEIVGDERVTKYKMDLPVVFTSVSSGPYKTFSQTIDGRRFTVWSPRMSQEQMRIQTELYAPILKFYNTIAPFPFSGYGALDSPHYGGGALEAYSYATYGGGLPAEDAHEPSHTWWGGILNNTYLNSFWNESFANFSVGLYARNVPIGKREERALAFIQGGNAQPIYNEVSCAESGADVGPAGSAMGYGKGAQVLQMLEVLMGIPELMGAMHDWVTNNPLGEPANWDGFEKAAIARRPDLNLKTFFDDWIRKPGYVNLDKTTVTYAEGKLIVNLKFEKENFRIPLEVLIKDQKGVETIKTFDVRTSTKLEIPLEEKPTLVSLDPYRRLLRDISPDETPIEFNRALNSMSVYVDPTHKDWQADSPGKSIATLPADLNGILLVGSPETLPAMKPLCDKVGFKVKGNTLTYQDTTINLDKGQAMAIVDLGNGKHCAIRLGKTRHPANPGRAHRALVDDLGRFLTGQTAPKTTGHLTYNP